MIYCSLLLENLQTLRVAWQVVRGVQEQMTISANEELSGGPAVEAFKEKRLSLVWLDGGIQKVGTFSCIFRSR